MTIVVTQEKLPKVVKTIHSKYKTIVLAGGVFDILHPGHIHFLEQAKKHGDFLLIIVESDEAVKKTKGETRPIFKQEDRIYALSQLKNIDGIIKLSGILSDSDYYRLTSLVKPAIIAATKDDPISIKKKEQAKQAGAQYVEVADRVGNYSSSKILKELNL